MRSSRCIALAALLAALGLAALPARRSAAEKIAVLVLGSSEKEAELADNLTEVLIAYVAQHGGFEIAGKEEFRARLGVENEKRAQSCLDDISCLGRAGVSLGVRRIVAGSVGTRGKQFLFNLNLDNVEDGKVESRVFRLVEGGVEDLIRAVQEASGELFRPRVEPGKIQVATQPDGARVSIDNAYLGVTPLISGTLLAGKHAVRVEADGRFPWASRVEVLPGQELQIRLSSDNLPRRRDLGPLRSLRLGRSRPGPRWRPAPSSASCRSFSRTDRPGRRRPTISSRSDTSRWPPTSRSVPPRSSAPSRSITSFATTTTSSDVPSITTTARDLP